MLSKVNLAFVGALTVLPHAALAADNYPSPSVEIAIPKDPIAGPRVSVPTSLPTTNIESECQDAQSTIDPELRSSAYEACVRDERSAFDGLRRGWAHYSADARATCVWPESGILTSYVALQTCLEMQLGGSLAVGVATDGLDSYSYDILPPTMASPSPAMGSPSPTNAPPSATMASPFPTMGPQSPTTGPQSPTTGSLSPTLAPSSPTLTPPSP